MEVLLKLNKVGHRLCAVNYVNSFPVIENKLGGKVVIVLFWLDNREFA